MASAPAELITALHTVPAPSLETRLRELRARLEMRDLDSAARALSTLEGEHPDDWRVVWYRGIASLVTGDHESAALSFDAVYDAFPGETAPKLALGICAEVLGQLDNAAEYYRLVWATDPGFVSAAFGLARVRMAAGERGRRWPPWSRCRRRRSTTRRRGWPPSGRDCASARTTSRCGPI